MYFYLDACHLVTVCAMEEAIPQAEKGPWDQSEGYAETHDRECNVSPIKLSHSSYKVKNPDPPE